VGQIEAPDLSVAQRTALAAIGPVQAEIRGLFSGNINVGRLYLRVYPEARDGENVFRQVQRILGRPETDLYVVGIYNLVDDLTPSETLALAALIDHWWQRPLLRLEATHLWMLWGEDDLVLSGGVSEQVSLVRIPGI
jgi:hypothetical protein